MRNSEKNETAMNRARTRMILLVLCASGILLAQNRTWLDVPYADQSNAQRLDLTVPLSDDALPLIVFIHGGAWTSGDKSQNLALYLARNGYVVASINYRLSSEAKWPAQIHDCKAAVRWLRAHADNYHIDADRIGAWGSSAGGHLANMMGTTGDVTTIQIDSLIMDLEGNIGSHPEYASAVQAVCNYYGPSNFLTIGDYPGGMNHLSPDSPESRLLGDCITENPNLARSASPVTYISQNDPPFIIFHGTEDLTVPFHQSVELDSALNKAGVDVTFIPMEGCGHGGREFETDEIKQTIRDFFDSRLKSPTSVQPQSPRNAGVYEPNDPYAPQQVRLQQNVPNPFNPETTVPFVLHQSGHVRLSVYNCLGREIIRLFDGPCSRGKHTIRWKPAGLYSGVYFIQLQASHIILTKRMTLVK